MDNLFKRVKQIILDEYLPAIVEKHGHAILHGDGNIYIDKTNVESKYQRSYLAKTFAACGNEAATYVIKFTSVNQIPDSLEKLEKMFTDAKAKENFDEGKIILNDDFLTFEKKVKPIVETEVETKKVKLNKKESL